MRYKAKTKDCHLIVKAKASWGEDIDEKALDAFARLGLRGFLKPNVIKKNMAEYDGPVGISLYERLKNPMSKRDFMFIMEQIVVAVQKIQGNNLSMSRVVLDLQNVFINDVTKEVQFLYVPSSKEMENPGISAFVDSIVYSVVPAGDVDSEFVSRFNYFLKGQHTFDPEIVERYIAKEDPSVVNTIKKQHVGQSGFIANGHKQYYDHYEKKQTLGDVSGRSSGGAQGGDATELLNENFAGNHRSSDGYVKNATDLLHGKAFGNGAAGNRGSYDYDETGLLHDNAYGNQPSGNRGSYDYDETGLLHDNAYGNQPSANYGSVDNGETGLLHDNMYGADATSLLNNGFANAPATRINEEEEGTMLLNEEWNVHYPSLLRVRNQQSISISKPVFRLGKERSYVDYFVTDNNAVSRSHADIITRGSKYFVMDMNSKNHTYINDRKIPPQCETEIRDGDRLRLANEEFIFYI